MDLHKQTDIQTRLYVHKFINFMRIVIVATLLFSIPEIIFALYLGNMPLLGLGLITLLISISALVTNILIHSLNLSAGVYVWCYCLGCSLSLIPLFAANFLPTILAGMLLCILLIALYISPRRISSAVIIFSILALISSLLEHFVPWQRIEPEGYYIAIYLPLNIITIPLVAIMIRVFGESLLHTTDKIINVMSDVLFFVKPDGQISLVNNMLLKIFGVQKDKIIGNHISNLFLSSDSKEDIVEKVLRGEEFKNYCVKIQTKDRKNIYLRFSNTVLFDDKNDVLGFICVASDDTSTKIYQDELLKSRETIQSSLHEKEVLLKEIHHRVKNNLYIVTSLLELEKDKTRNKEAITIINESVNRIRSMAIIHEKLYASKDLSKINIEDYLHQLSGVLLENYSTGTDIELEIKSEKLFMEINFMIPFGLMVNEMITNSIKYAFNGRENGRIVIQIYKKSEKILIFEFQDNGNGIPDSVDFRKPATLGLQIINDLTHQLDGSVELIRNEGTHYIFNFPLAD